MNGNRGLLSVVVVACMVVPGVAVAGLVPIVNADMSAITNDEFDGWVTNELVSNQEPNIRFPNLTGAATAGGVLSLSGQLEFSQQIGTVDADGSGLEFGVEIASGTSATFVNGYDFEVRIGGSALVKAADNSIDPPPWNQSFYNPTISFTAAELAPFAGQSIEIYGASRNSTGSVGSTLGFDNWTATVIAPPEPMPQVVSADFAYRYEFDVQPNTLDRDGNGAVDFWTGWNIGTITGDVSSATYTANNDTDRVATDFALGGNDSIWREHFLSGDWTVEVGLKITTPAGTEGSSGSIALMLATNGNNQENFWLRVGRNDMRITLPGGALQTIDTNDNTSDFVAIRVAQTDGKHYVWRDGELLNASLDPADGFAWAPNTIGIAGWRTSFGIAGRRYSGSLGGSVDFDYLRLDATGALAPVPEPATSVLAMLALVALGVCVRRKK